MNKKFHHKIIIFLSVLTLVGCYETEAIAKNNNSDKDIVINATLPEERWEYLVVSFGTTEFQKIDSGIRNGTSKLVAFREFADLLSGHEGINLQYKLDVLGRFGWEVVSALGRIAGDQQLVLKRERREDRIEKERKILEKLSVILKAEKEQREAELEAYIDKLTKQIKKKVTDELVELDAKEKREKELSSGIKAKEKILPLLPKVGDVVCENTVIKDVKLTVTASIDSKDKLTYEGKIKINIDATKALLKNKNQYRQSEASKLSSKCEKEILSSIKGYKKKSLGGFSLSGNIQINYKGKATSVSSLYETFDIKPFPSYFSDRY